MQVVDNDLHIMIHLIDNDSNGHKMIDVDSASLIFKMMQALMIIIT